MDFPEYDSRNKYFNTEASKLFKVKKTQVEMLKDRDYDINDEEWILKSNVDEFYKVYGVLQDNERYAKLSKIYTNGRGNRIFVFYPVLTTNKYLASTDITPVLSSSKEIRNIIIISELNYSAELNKQIIQLQSKNLFGKIENILNIQHFLYDELLFKVTDHTLVSKHVILSQEDAEKDVLEYVTFDKLPQISINDVICKYLGAEIGQIIEITVKSNNPFSDGIIDDYIYYRGVTDTRVKEKTSK